MNKEIKLFHSETGLVLPILSSTAESTETPTQHPQACWHTPLILLLYGLKQSYQEFKTTMDYIAILYLNK